MRSIPSLLEQVRYSDFSAIPQPLDWAQAPQLAGLLHCWDVSSALGLGELAFWAEERADEAANTGDWQGSVIELWLSLCFECRRFRHYGITPGESDAWSTGSARNCATSLSASARVSAGPSSNR